VCYNIAGPKGISLAAETAALTRPRARASISNDGFNYVRDLVRDQSAIVLEAGKLYLVERRLGLVARQGGFDSVQTMVDSLRTSRAGPLHRTVVEAMTNNETLFFRNPRVFSMLTSHILPALTAHLGSERTLNIWCAACSTGQEPYSLEMLVREAPSCGSRRVYLLASDFSNEALARARAGRYTQFEVNRGLPAPMLVKYFKQHRTAWEISPQLQQAIQFEEINLTQPWPALPAMNLIVLRNVLIYFDAETRRKILSKVARLLAPGGYLVLGASENTMEGDAGFEAVSFEGTICFRVTRER
jgi:chemotaxis protein methyltransferase CheR